MYISELNNYPIKFTIPSQDTLKKAMVSTCDLQDVRLGIAWATITFTMNDFSPQQVAEVLGKRKNFVWSCNSYLLAVTEALRVEGSGGMCGLDQCITTKHPIFGYEVPAAWGTVEEIKPFGEGLGETATG